MENDDAVELNDESYNFLLTKICDLGVYNSINKNIIESDEDEGAQPPLPHISWSHTPASYPDMIQ